MTEEVTMQWKGSWEFRIARVTHLNEAFIAREVQGRRQLSSSVSSQNILVPDTDQISRLTTLSSVLYHRFLSGRDPQDIEVAAITARIAVSLAGDGDAGILLILAHSLLAQSYISWDMKTSQHCTHILFEALSFYPSDCPDHHIAILALSKAFHLRFCRTGSEWHLIRAGFYLTQLGVPFAQPGGNEIWDYGLYFVTLGAAAFKQTGNRESLDRVYSFGDMLLCLCNPNVSQPTTAQFQRAILHTISRLTLLVYHTEHTVKNLHLAISYIQDAAKLSTIDELARAEVLTTMSVAYRLRFEHTSDESDLNLAMQHAGDAIIGIRPASAFEINALCAASSSKLLNFISFGDEADLNYATDRANTALSLSPTGHPERAQCLITLAHALCISHIHDCQKHGVQECITHLREAVEVLNSQAPCLKAIALRHLSFVLFLKFVVSERGEDFKEALQLFHDGADEFSLPPDHIHSLLHAAWYTYANTVVIKFADSDDRQTLDSEDSEPSISGKLRNAMQTLSRFPPGHLHRSILLICIGGLHLALAMLRSPSSRRSQGLATAAKYMEAAYTSSTPRSLYRTASLVGLITVLSAEHQDPRDPVYASRLTTFLHEASSLHASGHKFPSRISFQTASATHPQQPFGTDAETPQTESINRAVRSLGQTYSLIAATNDPDPVCLSLLQLLSDAFEAKFRQSESEADITQSLEYHDHTLDPTPPGGSDHVYAMLHERLNSSLALKGDALMGESPTALQETISFARELFSSGMSDLGVRIQTTKNLCHALYSHFIASDMKHPENLQNCIMCGKQYLTLIHPGDAVNRSHILRPLVSALIRRHSQKEDPEDLEDLQLSIRYLEEFLSLPEDIRLGTLSEYSSEESGDPSLGMMRLLGCTLKERNEAHGLQDSGLDRSIEYFRGASESCPSGDPNRSGMVLTFAFCLFQRCLLRYKLKDIEDVIECLQEAMRLAPEPLNSPTHIEIAKELSIIYPFRFNLTNHPDDINLSVHYGYKAVELCPPGNRSDRSEMAYVLANSLRRRYQLYGQREDLDNALAYLREAAQCHESLSELDGELRVKGFTILCLTDLLEEEENNLEAADQCISKAKDVLDKCPPLSPLHPRLLYGLAKAYRCRFQASKQSADLDTAMNYFEHLEATGNIEDVAFHYVLAYEMHRTLYTRYEATQQKADLDASIEIGLKNWYQCPVGEEDGEHRFDTARLLWLSFIRRCTDTHRSEDLENAITYAKECATRGTLHNLEAHMGVAGHWAEVAHAHRHESTLQAYRTCFEISGRHLAVTPTLEMQQDITQLLATLPTAAASYAISLNDLPLAVELLEQGRAILWSQVRQWRTQLHKQSSIEGQELWNALLAKNRELEDLATSASPFGHQPTRYYSSGRRPEWNASSDTYGAMLEKKRQLTTEIQGLNEKISQLPGMGESSRLPSWSSLRAVADEGPVIIVNYSKFRCDALILHSNGSITLVPLAESFLVDTLNILHDLLEKREEIDLNPKKYDKALGRALQDIWDLLVEPVVDKLKELGVRPGSRIWWCPTGVLSSLPIHAAGPTTRSGQKAKREYLPDIYISSYTPTLSALIQARNNIPTRSSAAKPSLLGVVVLDDSTLSAADMEVQVLKKHFAYPDNLSLMSGSKCNPKAVLAGLAERPWVHFTCHGVEMLGKPFESALLLPDEQRLTLMNIVKGGLHNAELAVLSACHTASFTSPTEEVLHLAAAMQVAGFRGVVGTMWQMKDEDGPSFADDFYEILLAEGEEGQAGPSCPKHKFQNAAKAVCEATARMRKRKVNLERWVNFIHIGA